MVVDAAHGAAFEVAPTLLQRLGAKVTAINTVPTGTNINVNCGSTYPQDLQRAVQETGADIGLALTVMPTGYLLWMNKDNW